MEYSLGYCIINEVEEDDEQAVIIGSQGLWTQLEFDIALIVDRRALIGKFYQFYYEDVDDDGRPLGLIGNGIVNVPPCHLVALDENWDVIMYHGFNSGDIYNNVIGSEGEITTWQYLHLFPRYGDPNSDEVYVVLFGSPPDSEEVLHMTIESTMVGLVYTNTKDEATEMIKEFPEYQEELSMIKQIHRDDYNNLYGDNYGHDVHDVIYNDHGHMFNEQYTYGAIGKLPAVYRALL